MTQHETEKLIAQYRHWIDRPYEPEPPAPTTPPWRPSDVVGVVIALVLAGAGLAAIFA